jgi:hypothetical protein
MNLERIINHHTCVLLMPRRRKLKRHVGLAGLILVIILASFFFIKIYAEHRTEDFIIESYLVPENVYPSEAEARDNMVLEETHWSFSKYCMVATVYFGKGSERMSTSIIIETPALAYAFNSKKAVEKMKMVGEC